MNGRELFAKKNIEIKSDNKRRVLTDRQLLAINRDKTIKYFCQAWQNKYALPYVIPPKSFMTVEKPISDALAQNYTVDMLSKAIDTYLANDFVGYMEQSHPIRFFTKDITKWVMQSRKEVKREQAKSGEDRLRELNFKYGIVKKGDSYIDEEGNVYIDEVSAIKGVENKKGKKS